MKFQDLFSKKNIFFRMSSAANFARRFKGCAVKMPEGKIPYTKMSEEKCHR